MPLTHDIGGSNPLSTTQDDRYGGRLSFCGTVRGVGREYPRRTRTNGVSEDGTTKSTFRRTRHSKRGAARPIRQDERPEPPAVRLLRETPSRPPPNDHAKKSVNVTLPSTLEVRRSDPQQLALSSQSPVAGRQKQRKQKLVGKIRRVTFSAQDKTRTCTN